MNYWKYNSQNTHDDLSLHDCECGCFIVNDDKIIMEMEWMEVLASHPDNVYSKAHQSKEGRIEFHDVSNVQIETGDYLNKTLEILDCDSEEMDIGFQIHINAITSDRNNRKQDFLSLSFRCQSSVVMFNELGDESWFEDFKKK